MSHFGLPACTLETLQRIFSGYPTVASVRLYGSRAKGTYNPRSDIDLAVFGPSVDRFVVAAILQDIDDSDIPYLVDIQNFSGLRNPALIEHIERVGQEIYRRPT